MQELESIRKKLFDGEAEEVAGLVRQLLDEGLSTEKILNEGLIAGMGVVGQKFREDEIFIPEVMLAARAMQAGMDVLEPHLVKANVKPKGKIVIGTVKGDLHDIGKNLVAMMLKGAGFKIEDLGVDVQPERFIDAVKQKDAQIVAMSALLTTSMPSMQQTIELLKKDNLIPNVKTMIGGAPLTQGYADKIGADAYGPDASSAVDIAKELLGIS